MSAGVRLCLPVSTYATHNTELHNYNDFHVVLDGVSDVNNCLPLGDLPIRQTELKDTHNRLDLYSNRFNLFY